MPMYSYKCKCGKQFESSISMKDCEKSQPCECGNLADRIIDNFGMYEIKGNNQASTSPKSTVKNNR